MSHKSMKGAMSRNKTRRNLTQKGGDPFKFTKIGLQNCGNTCYLNSLTQQLMHCPVFIDFLEKADAKIPETNKGNSISSQLLRLYKEMTETTLKKFSEKNTNNIFNLIGKLAENKQNENMKVVQNYNIYGKGQQDPQEAIMGILEDIENENFQINNENIEDILNYYKTYILIVNDERTCPNCQYKSSSFDFVTPGGTSLQILKESDAETFNEKVKNINVVLGGNNELSDEMKDMQVLRNGKTVAGIKALEENKSININNLANEYQSDTLNAQNSFCVNCCQNNQHMKKLEFMKMPLLFSFIIKRFQQIDSNFDYRVKINDVIENITQNIKVNDNNYKILSTLVHKGYGPNGGHYVALCKDSTNKWSLFNDDSVTQIEIKDNEMNEYYNNENASPYFFIYENEDQTTKNYNAADLFIALFIAPTKRQLLLNEKYKNYFAAQKSSFIDFKDLMNNTVLHIICNYADSSDITHEYISQVVNFLIDTIGCKLEDKNINGETPFMLASNSPFSPLFRMLLQKSGENAEIQISTKNTATTPKSALDKITCIVNKEIGKFGDFMNNFKKAKTDGNLVRIIETGENAIFWFDNFHTLFNEPSLKTAFSELNQNFLTEENKNDLITYFTTEFDFEKTTNQRELLIKRCKQIIKICKKYAADNNWLTKLPSNYKENEAATETIVAVSTTAPETETKPIVVAAAPSTTPIVVEKPETIVEEKPTVEEKPIVAAASSTKPIVEEKPETIVVAAKPETIVEEKPIVVASSTTPIVAASSTTPIVVAAESKPISSSTAATKPIVAAASTAEPIEITPNTVQCSVIVKFVKNDDYLNISEFRIATEEDCKKAIPILEPNYNKIVAGQEYLTFVNFDTKNEYFANVDWQNQDETKCSNQLSEKVFNVSKDAATGPTPEAPGATTASVSGAAPEATKAPEVATKAAEATTRNLIPASNPPKAPEAATKAPEAATRKLTPAAKTIVATGATSINPQETIITRSKAKEIKATTQVVNPIATLPDKFKDVNQGDWVQDNVGKYYRVINLKEDDERPTNYILTYRYSIKLKQGVTIPLENAGLNDMEFEDNKSNITKGNPKNGFTKVDPDEKNKLEQILNNNVIKKGDWILCDIGYNKFCKVSEDPSIIRSGKLEIKSNLKIHNSTKKENTELLKNTDSTTFEFDSMKCKKVVDANILSKLENIAKNNNGSDVDTELSNILLKKIE